MQGSMPLGPGLGNSGLVFWFSSVLFWVGILLYCSLFSCLKPMLRVSPFFVISLWLKRETHQFVFLFSMIPKSLDHMSISWPHKCFCLFILGKNRKWGLPPAVILASHSQQLCGIMQQKHGTLSSTSVAWKQESPPLYPCRHLLYFLQTKTYIIIIFAQNTVSLCFLYHTPQLIPLPRVHY